MNSTTKLPTILWFLIPSLIGIFIFMLPISYTADGQSQLTIPIAFISETAEMAFAPILAEMTMVLATLSVLGSLVYLYVKPTWMNNSVFASIFNVSTFWLIVRIIGLTLGLFIFFQVGPEWIWGEDTGGLILDLVSFLIVVFLFAGIFLPLLLNFGLLEFVGTLMNIIMRPLFRLPGRSSIDTLASWFGDATIGVMMSNQQYIDGHYTKREAAVLGTTFNIVSITFTIVILGYLDLEHLFIPYYATIVIAGLVAALIMPRIPPLSRFSDDYYEYATPKRNEEASNEPLLKIAWRGAMTRAAHARIRDTGKQGMQNVLDLWFGVIPIVLAIGTVTIIIAEQTPVFTWLGMPFIPFLELMQVPEAAAASETMLIGFADMLLPALIGSGIESEMTRFIIGCLSVTQLIFMSEVGGLLLASKIPVNFWHLVAIFLLRTIITLPVIILCAHVVFTL
ncbi:predicted arginine uptake transporter [Geomicrobium sp. JCM 19037]|uniref:YjiH family protein n=1 Tax=Geomicrobium sp. JCM 19037 TaxID=1460634 RepID=UPI00045F3F69|nr:YjiH family protein [Geomicrobium sp. JCM 19037]GAK01823.1 predicted arginine uptake transporter [Geomicrobium sp. JCM 19037]